MNVCLAIEYRFVRLPDGSVWTPHQVDIARHVEGLGDGFQLTAPADPVQRTLTVFVGVWNAQGKMVAHLSDNSTADYIDTSLNSASGTRAGMYKFVYQAAIPGQTLTVTFTQNNNAGGNVTLQAAALNGNTADFGLSATPATQSIDRGTSATYTVSMSAQNGFSGSVALAASGVPTGAAATLNPPIISAGLRLLQVRRAAGGGRQDVQGATAARAGAAARPAREVTGWRGPAGPRLRRVLPGPLHLQRQDLPFQALDLRVFRRARSPRLDSVHVSLYNSPIVGPVL
jgi:hypothetical protein